MALLQTTWFENVRVTFCVTVPYRTWRLPENLQVAPSFPHNVHAAVEPVGEAGVVAGGVTGVTAGTGVLWYQHCLREPNAGSPNTLLSQAMLPVAVRVAYLVDVPYRTCRVPLNRHAPPSLLHSTQVAAVSAKAVTLRLPALAVEASRLEESAPPQALARAAAAIRLDTR